MKVAIPQMPDYSNLLLCAVQMGCCKILQSMHMYYQMTAKRKHVCAASLLPQQAAVLAWYSQSNLIAGAAKKRTQLELHN